MFLSSRRLKDETGGTETARIHWFLFFDSIIRTHGAPGLFFRTFITIHCQNKGSLVTVMSVSLLVFVEAVVEAYVTVTVTAVPPPPRCASQVRPPRRCCKYNFLFMDISKQLFITREITVVSLASPACLLPIASPCLFMYRRWYEGRSGNGSKS